MSKTISEVMQELLDATSAAVQRCEGTTTEAFTRAYATLESTTSPSFGTSTASSAGVRELGAIGAPAPGA